MIPTREQLEKARHVEFRAYGYFTAFCDLNRSCEECDRIIQSIEHFYGHLEIECCGRLGLCSVEYKEDLETKKDEIISFCKNII